MWFRNFYAAFAFVVCVRVRVRACASACVKINNEELFFNAFLFEN